MMRPDIDMPANEDCAVLIVEDESGAQLALRTLISKRYPRLKLHVASDGEEGLELFRQVNPQIVLTDLNLPKLDGLRMAEAIRSLAPEVEVIALTGNDDCGQIIRSIRIGVSRYVLKPIELRQLYEAIDTSLGRVRDFARQKIAEEALQRSEQRLRHALDAARLGSWEYRLPSGELVLDERCRTILGLGSEEPMSAAQALLTTHPEDRAGVSEAYRQPAAGGEYATCQEEHRVVLPTGEVRWVSSHAKIHPCSDGVNTWCLTGIVIDITAQKRVQRELLQNRDNLADLVLEKTRELKARNQRLNAEIKQRKLAEEEIRMLNATLELRVKQRTAEREAAVRELESFSYSVSHDLRAPLRHINSYSAIIAEDFGSCLPAEARGYLERMGAATARMGALIDHLLEVSRVGRVALRKETVDLSALVKSVAGALPGDSDARRLELVVQEGLFATGDPILLRQLLENLCDNAWKYSSKKPVSRLEFGRSGESDHSCFYLKDNGAGFDMAHSHRLFKIFERLHGSEFAGVGIGLATVQRIVERHGGKVWAQGTLDEGATFYFTLP